MGLDDRRPVRLSRGAVRELARQVKRVERDYLNSGGPDYRPRIQPLTVIKAIVTSSAIGTASGTTPGSGTATIYYWDGSTMQLDPERTDVPVYNWFNGYAPAQGAHIHLYWQDNAYWLGPGDC